MQVVADSLWGDLETFDALRVWRRVILFLSSLDLGADHFHDRGYSKG